MAERVIYKYPFDSGALHAPDGNVLLVGWQGARQVPTLWIEHDVDAPVVAYYVRPTGEAFFDAGDEHVGSAICGAFVWHVYKRKAS